MPDKVSIVRRTGCPHVDQLNENGQWIIRESLGECQHKKHRGDVTLDSKYPSIQASEHPSIQVSKFRDKSAELELAFLPCRKHGAQNPSTPKCAEFCRQLTFGLVKTSCSPVDPPSTGNPGGDQ